MGDLVRKERNSEYGVVTLDFVIYINTVKPKEGILRNGVANNCYSL